MANTTLNTILILRNGTAAEWSNTSVILMKGEMAVEFQTSSNGEISGQPKLKVGDGESAYVDLPYIGLTESEINTVISEAVGDLKNFSKIKVNTTDIQPATYTDTLTLTAGDNITLTPNATNKQIQIKATDTTYENATSGKAGLMSGTDKGNLDSAVSKLSGIEAGAQENVIESIKVNNTALIPDANKAVNITVPTKTGELTNNSGFITKAVNDLTNYYKKSETYTQTEINDKLSAIPKFAIQVVQSLPTSNISATTVYLVSTGSETNNLYTEYIYVNNKWEILGTQKLDLSPYVKSTDLAAVATSGSYADLIDEPTKLSEFTNDKNFPSDANYVHTDNNYTTTEKNKLSGIASGAQVNKIESVQVEGTALSISNKQVNITKESLGLDNVDNTADADKTVGKATMLETARTIDGVSFNGTANIIHYGTCSTAAGSNPKTVDCTGFTLDTGAIIYVRFTATNSVAVASVQLNVNNTGAKNIKYRNSNLSSAGILAANRIYCFVYDGTNYQIVGDLDSNSTYTNMSLGNGYGTCATDGATATKVVTLSGYSLLVGGVVAVKFTNAVPANATMNINSKGAKNIYYHGSAITANIIQAGDIATFIYNGTQYDLIAIDRVAKETITGLQLSGRTITITKGDGSTSTLTTQDTTYDIATSSVAGLVKSATGTNQVAVNSTTGVMSFSAVQTDTFVQGVNTLILNGGGAS